MKVAKLRWQREITRLLKIFCLRKAVFVDGNFFQKNQKEQVSPRLFVFTHSINRKTLKRNWETMLSFENPDSQLEKVKNFMEFVLKRSQS